MRCWQGKKERKKEKKKEYAHGRGLRKPAGLGHEVLAKREETSRLADGHSVHRSLQPLAPWGQLSFESDPESVPWESTHHLQVDASRLLDLPLVLLAVPTGWGQSGSTGVRLGKPGVGACPWDEQVGDD